MTLDPRLLEILACPVCRAALDYKEPSELACKGCGRLYAVAEGIPNLLSEEARLPEGPRKRVLFVCVENSCRSQMAEGFARALGLEAASAGSQPSGRVDESAIAVMKERGIDISKQISKGVAGLAAGTWNAVVTMGCGDACPSVPARLRLDWDLPDPKGLPLDEFRKARDRIESEIRRLLPALSSGVDSGGLGG